MDSKIFSIIVAACRLEARKWNMDPREAWGIVWERLNNRLHREEMQSDKELLRYARFQARKYFWGDHNRGIRQGSPNENHALFVITGR